MLNNIKSYTQKVRFLLICLEVNFNIYLPLHPVSKIKALIISGFLFA